MSNLTMNERLIAAGVTTTDGRPYINGWGDTVINKYLNYAGKQVQRPRCVQACPTVCLMHLGVRI